jgi:serine/threonine protein kinase
VDIISDKRVVYIMPWYKGREYIKVIADDFPGLELTPLEKVRCAKIAWGCGNAVEELHLSGVVHGDINNAQLKLDDEDNVKIYDFGHSFILTQDTKVFYDSKRGAEGYIAPEVLKKNMYSTKSDDFSLGEILRDNPLYDSDDEFAGVVFRLTAQNPDMRMTASEALPMLKAIWERLAIEAQAEVKLQAGFAKLAL